VERPSNHKFVARSSKLPQAQRERERNGRRKQPQLIYFKIKLKLN